MFRNAGGPGHTIRYSQKCHEKQADMCFRKHRRQQAALVAFTASSTGTFPASLLGNFVSPRMAGLHARDRPSSSFIAYESGLVGTDRAERSRSSAGGRPSA
ncbi:hypothetical protein [Amycolatopsis sp. WAC 01416]|uniref:hypothetical protein n=1 Tax=Amycolatopsis sp. WAC 01416 TaxID=2203196 RepID=UPI00351A519D